MTPNSLKSQKVFSVPVHLCENYTQWLKSCLDAQTSVHVVTLNSEMVMLAETDPAVAQAISQADLVVPDGAGVTFYLKRQGIRQTRCPGIELSGSLLEAIAALPSPPLVVFYGGKPGIPETAAQKWRTRFPQLPILANHGYLSPEEEAAWLQLLQDKQPQVIFVGLGVPRQEFWIQQHRHLCPQSIWVGVGGSFDVWSGQKQRAPKWFCDNNLEWLYRLYQEPWRWKRMLVLPQFLLRTLTHPKTSAQ